MVGVQVIEIILKMLKIVRKLVSQTACTKNRKRNKHFFEKQGIAGTKCAHLLSWYNALVRI